MENETLTEIQSAVDIVTARQRGRALALELGFGRADVTLIIAAISEVARNIVEHAKQGRIVMRRIQAGDDPGIQIIATDKGPGIHDVGHAMQYGNSSRKGLGVGLPGAKWLMDEFDIDSHVGKGTTVTMKKWLR